MAFESWRRVRRFTPGLPWLQDRRRARLLAGMGDWNAYLAHHAALLTELTANPSEDPTGLDRAMTALHMYSAVEAIEELEDAFVRLADGRYGTCQSCDRPIPVERFEEIAHTRFCSACPTAADAPAQPHRPSGRRGREDPRHPPANLLAAMRASRAPRVLAASRARHPSSVRHEHPLDESAPR